MASKSNIEWTDATWNPIVGCSIVSPGCTNCYAMKVAARVEACFKGTTGAPHYRGLTQASKAGPVWTGKVQIAPDEKLTEPLRWRKPRKIFVNSEGDLFHESVPDEWIDKVFAIMKLCPHHTFQVLTKRSTRMRSYLSHIEVAARVTDDIVEIAEDLNLSIATLPGWRQRDDGFHEISMPYPNIWLGVSTERQKEADERIPDLLATPAAMRFISAEPLLGPLDLRHVRAPDDGGEGWTFDALTTGDIYYQKIERLLDPPVWEPGDGPHRETKLDWIIAGGESGRRARPMHPDWVRSLRDQCAAGEVPFFFKQWGEWIGVGQIVADERGITGNEPVAFIDGVRPRVSRVGKKRAGRLLDGVEHNEFPVIKVETQAA